MNGAVAAPPVSGGADLLFGQEVMGCRLLAEAKQSLDDVGCAPRATTY